MSRDGNITDRHIVLIGSSGAGKSSIAEAVHEKYGVPKYDTDEWVVDTTGLAIPKIFEEDGEPYFRFLEARALRRILDNDPGITATGDGIAGSDVGYSALRYAEATIIWLKVGLDIAWDRVKEDSNRRLAQDFDVFETRFNLRQPLYRSAAHFAIDTELQSFDETVARVADYI